VARYVPWSLLERLLCSERALLGILRQKGIEVHGVDFLRQNILPLVVTSGVALAVVLAEVRVMFPND